MFINYLKKNAFVFTFSFITCAFSQVGIGTTSPNSDAELDINSTTRGVLLPRVPLTNTTSPAPLTTDVAGMLVYNTAIAGDVTPGFYYNDGAIWVRINPAQSTDWTISGNAGTTPTTNFVGTTDAQDLVLSRNSTPKIRVLNSYTGFTDEIIIRDGSPNGATSLVSIDDRGNTNDGRIRIYRNNNIQHNLDGNGAVIFNENSGNFDFRIESNNDTNAFFLEGADGQITLGEYGTGAHTGTSTRMLTVDTNGNIIEEPLIANTVSAWGITGNTGTTAGTNFLGTTDAQDLRIHTNGAERMRVRSDGLVGINSAGQAGSHLDVAGNSGNDAITAATDANGASLRNALWARNLNNTGTAILAASQGIGGISPVDGAAVAGSSTNNIAISGNVGQGRPNNNADNGNHVGDFGLDSDNNEGTNNQSAVAFLAGKDRQDLDGFGLARFLYGGYFQGGVNNPAWSYVGMKYDHNNNATATGGTDYKILGIGLVSTVVKDQNSTGRIMFAPEAPEVLFQDYGIGKLSNGSTTITIDEIFTKNIKVDQKHPLKVFIQLEGDCNGVYVTNKSDKGFTVKELAGGNSNTSFSWQIIATRANTIGKDGEVSSHHENLRFPYAPKPLERTKNISRKTRKSNIK